MNVVIVRRSLYKNSPAKFSRAVFVFNDDQHRDGDACDDDDDVDVDQTDQACPVPSRFRK